jgi:hypothetical protein
LVSESSTLHFDQAAVATSRIRGEEVLAVQVKHGLSCSQDNGECPTWRISDSALSELWAGRVFRWCAELDRRTEAVRDII